MLCDGLSRTIDASVLACRRSGTRYRTTKTQFSPGMDQATGLAPMLCEKLDAGTK